MKKITVAIALTFALCVPYSAPSQADQIATSICGSVASDNKSRLRSQLRSNKLKLKKIYKGFSCNGQSLLRFAMSNNADTVGPFIAKRLSKSILVKKESDGVTPYEWALANSKGDSATALAVKSRAKL
ncbi:MAG: DUF3718 domain-containing protein [Psychrobium sp.]|nr:DUF3718 domain-containing protein [Psychrobium sp.]